MSQPLRAVITGAGSGLGRALALDIARRGGRSVLADINQEGLRETARLVASAGTEAHTVACDVAVVEQVDALAADAARLLGQVDLLANNAGVAVGGQFEQVPLEDWRWIMDINLWGVIYGCRAFLPAMQAQGRGYIINVASAAGLLCTPGLSPYNVTKAGVVALSESLYAETRSRGVNVSVLCPTFFVTGIMDSARGPAMTRMRTGLKKLMTRSSIQAPDVARIAVDAVLRGELYALPMRDARILWRLKRAMPDRFYDLTHAAMRVTARLG